MSVVVFIIVIIIICACVLKKCADLCREYEDLYEWDSNIGNKEYDFTKKDKE